MTDPNVIYQPEGHEYVVHCQKQAADCYAYARSYTCIGDLKAAKVFQEDAEKLSSWARQVLQKMQDTEAKA